MAVTAAQPQLTPQSLRSTAHDYYEWQKREFPVFARDQGFHAYDDGVTDYSPGAVSRRSAHVRELLQQVRMTDISKWAKDDQIDAILFRAQLESPDFANRVRKLEQSNPSIYVDEASNAIFSLLKKDYDTPRNRAIAATSRLQKVPAMIEQGKKNLTQPVRLYSEFAIQSARSIDPLLNDSLMTLAADMTPAERDALIAAKTNALRAIHGYADSLEERLPSMAAWKPLGLQNHQVKPQRNLLLPFCAPDNPP